MVVDKIKNVRWWKPTELEISEIQKFYDEKNSLNKCGVKFGWSKSTLIKYLKTRSPGRIAAGEEIRKKKNVTKVVGWRKRTKQKLVDYKGGKCQICGYNRWIGNLAFHHLDPSKKDFSITSKTIAFERLKVEVDKYALLCHICHGEVHAGLISIPL